MHSTAKGGRMPHLILVKHAMPVIQPEHNSHTWSLSESGRLACTALAQQLAGFAPEGAGEQVPFKGHFNPVIVSSTQIDATHILFTVAVSGHATELGNFQGPATFTLGLTDLTYTGSTTW